ncbi:hypothetical protein FRC00_007769, partial [Tulasnella sp. 408]
KSSKLTLPDGKRLYRAAFGLPTLPNVKDKNALAKKASNPAIYVNWEAVTSLSDELDSTFTPQEKEFYKVLRDLVQKGRVNPAEWSHAPTLNESAPTISTDVTAPVTSTPMANATSGASPPLPRNLYVQVVQADKTTSQAVLQGFEAFVVEDGVEMAETPHLVACLLDKIMPPFMHTLRLGVEAESFFDTEGDETPVTWFAKLERVERGNTPACSDIKTIIEGQVYQYLDVKYKIAFGAVGVTPYGRDAHGFRVKLFAEEWIPDTVLEDAAARSKAEKKAQKDEEKRKRDRCAIGYLHAQFHDHSTMVMIRELHKEKSAKKVIKLSFQNMVAVAGLKAEIRRQFKSQHSNQDIIPWINPDPGFQGRPTQVKNLLKGSITFPEDHQLQAFYGFGSSWLSNLNYFSTAIDEIEKNGTDELIKRLDNWREEGMVDKGILSGLDSDSMADIKDATILEQGAESWKSTMKLVLQTAHQKGLVMG